MKKILVVGAGKIGSTIADFLDATGDYAVTLIDRDQPGLDRADVGPQVRRVRVDIAREGALGPLMEGHYAVLSAAPYHLTTAIATAAAAAGIHYLDLTEDVASTRAVRALAAGAQSAFIPQCGLAPGFVSIVAHDIAQRFERLDTIHLRAVFRTFADASRRTGRPSWRRRTLCLRQLGIRYACCVERGRSRLRRGRSADRAGDACLLGGIREDR